MRNLCYVNDKVPISKLKELLNINFDVAFYSVTDKDGIATSRDHINGFVHRVLVINNKPYCVDALAMTDGILEMTENRNGVKHIFNTFPKIEEYNGDTYKWLMNAWA